MPTVSELSTGLEGVQEEGDQQRYHHQKGNRVKGVKSQC